MAAARAAEHSRFGVVTLEDGGFGVATLRDALLARFDSPGYRPPVLPSVALDLHAMARDPDVRLDKVARLAEKEPLLCASVVRRAQSAFFSRGERVQSIKAAIVRLGTVEVSNIFLELAMSARVFRARGFEGPMERLRRHAVATAQAATRVARRTAIFDEYAFLCGLLHDVGLAAGIIAISDAHRPADLPLFEEAWPALFSVHEEAARVLCRIWNLPADVALVLANHHAPRIGGMVHPLAAVVAISEYEAALAGHEIGERGDDPTWARAALSLEGQDQAIRTELAAAFRAVS
jgi:HD-like signal output (HDOD) protein